MPPLTQALIVANVLVFLLDQLLGNALTGWFALWPLGSALFMPWQLVSYAFLHGNLSHLAFNMFGLWMFGGKLERIWDSRRLGAFYGASLFAAGVMQLIVTAALRSNVPTVGASGGLFGLLIGFAMVFPSRTITPLIPPIPMPAWLFVSLYGLMELTLGVTGSASGVAHFTHLGGLFGGWLVMRYWRSQSAFDWRHRQCSPCYNV